MNVETLTEPGTTSSAGRSADGAAWAALMAAGIGCAAFGIFTDLSEVSARVGSMLNWYNPAGSLSGVAGCAIIVWAAGWVVLAARWKNRRLARPGRIMLLTILLVLAGLILTFPPFYSIFAHD